MWRENQLDSDDSFAKLREDALAGRTVYVVCEDAPTAKAWATYRDMPGGQRSPQFVQSAQMLYGVTDRDLITLVVLRGSTGKKGWQALRQRLQIVDAGGVPVMFDELPGSQKPVAPLIGGCLVPRGGQPSRIPYQSQQGDTFVIRALGGEQVSLRRDQIDGVVDMLTAWKTGSVPRDPEAERAAAIREAIAASGDPFALDQS